VSTPSKQAKQEQQTDGFLKPTSLCTVLLTTQNIYFVSSLLMKQRSPNSILPVTTHDSKSNIATDPPTKTAPPDPPAEATKSINNMSTSSSQPYKPSPTMYRTLVTALLLYSVGVGYWVAVVKQNYKWKDPFSYHPFFMTIGFVGCMGIGAVTKKLGGYTNTKLHGIFASVGFFCSVGGFYAIYKNKNLWERPHFTSIHGKMGLALLLATIPAMLAGGVFLHPDWGIDKTNKTYRKIHKQFSRSIIAAAWLTAIYGFYCMKVSMFELLIYAGPLLLLAPFVLV
jgi:Eukaryotic cytochrome b561